MGMTTVHTTIIPQGICHYSFIAQNLQAENSVVVCKIILSVYFKTSSVLFCIALRKKLSLIKYLEKIYLKTGNKDKPLSVLILGTHFHIGSEVSDS